MPALQGDDRLEGEAPAESPPPAEESASAVQPGAKRRTTRKRETTGSGRRASTKVSDNTTAEEKDGVTLIGEAPLPKPRLLELFRSEILPTMMREFGYRNTMEVPRLTKVVVNIGLGEALTNPKAIESATKDLTAISGQKPIVARAKNSIAGFKLRQGNPIGVCVTLRGVRMYYFVERLLNAALPRIRDFRGVSPTSFDGRGNYSMGIREQTIFSELEYGQIERIRGFQVTIGTTARTDGEAARLLALLGMPFAKQQ